MNQPESIGNPEQPAFDKERLLELIEASDNMRILRDIVASDEFDVSAALDRGVRLGKNLDDEKKKCWATLRFEQEDDEVVARFIQTYPYTVHYAIPDKGKSFVWRPESTKKRQVFFANKGKLMARLNNLEVA